jgi:hyperosmotically inducible protein
MNQRTLLIAPLMVGILAMTACDKQPSSQTVGQKVDSAIASTENKAADAKKDTTEAVTDAAITTRVNAQLATDPSLSALKINVDTQNGRVSLHGVAPDATSRDRAATMASAVSGVVSVDNQLKLDKKS